MTTSANLQMIRGDSLDLDLAITQGGAPVNLAGATIWMTAKRSYADADVDAVFQISSPTDIVITNAALGLARISVPPTATSSLVFSGAADQKFLFDIQVQLASGKVFTVRRGELTVSPDVTRATV